MTAVIISNTPPFGAMTNQAVSNLFTLNEQLTRLAAAVATAASSYTGTAGTEYEGNSTNFGVSASSTPGQQGSSYSFALGNLTTNWATFWTNNVAYINALDNGVIT